MTNIEWDQRYIEIVYDPQKKKNRARCIDDGHWVRFPKKLRTKCGTIYKAHEMVFSEAGEYWIAKKPYEKVEE